MIEKKWFRVLIYTMNILVPITLIYPGTPALLKNIKNKDVWTWARY